jgi:hypothetical protein
LKGLELSITTIVLIILALVVLISFVYLFLLNKNQISIIEYQSALRGCCGDRTRYKCDGSIAPSSIQCKVSWSSGTESMDSLMDKAGVDPDNIGPFCLCGDQ